jgi:hypothetical protein
MTVSEEDGTERVVAVRRVWAVLLTHCKHADLWEDED